MNIKSIKKYYFSNALDFLIANVIIIVTVRYINDVIDFLVPPVSLDNYIHMPKYYLSFIEGLMAGIFMSMYLLLKKNINVLFMILGMWSYPAMKSTSSILNDLESWLHYLSKLSMFIGVFFILFYLASFIVNRKF